jgi:hypothetical protein
MSILVVCPHCEHTFPPGRVPRDRKLACPGCSKLFLLTAERLKEAEPAPSQEGLAPAGGVGGRGAAPATPPEATWVTFRDGTALVCRGLLIEAAALAALLVIPWITTSSTPADSAGLRVLSMASVLALAAGSAAVALGRTRQSQHPQVRAEPIPSRAVAQIGWGGVAAFLLAVVPVLVFATVAAVSQSRTPLSKQSISDAVSRENTAFLLVHLGMLGVLVSCGCRLAADFGSTVHIAFVARGARTAELLERVNQLNAIIRVIGGCFALFLVIVYAGMVSDPPSGDGAGGSNSPFSGTQVLGVLCSVTLGYLFLHLVLNQTAHEVAADLEPEHPDDAPAADPRADA